MKKLFSTILVLGFLLSGNAFSDEDVAKTIERCADHLVKHEEAKLLEDYKAAYDLEAEMIFLTNSLQDIERWIKFLKNELDVLDKEWDQNYAFYQKHLDEYKDIKNDRTYLSRFNDKYLKNITGDLLYQDSYRKKIGSTYFLNRDITRKQIKKALDDNERWDKEKKERVNYLLTPEGEKEFNAKLKVKMLKIKHDFKTLRKQELIKKIEDNKYDYLTSSFSYVEFFKICETARMGNPILFNTKFK